MSNIYKHDGFDIITVMKHTHHIIPKHMGGTDEPNNLIELTIEEHADAHKKLYEEFGHWQDYVAWQGLAKLDEKFDAAKQAMIEGGKKGAAKANMRWQDPVLREKYKKQQSIKLLGRGKTWKGKIYEVIHPSGTIEIVEGLKQWCEDRNLKANTFANASLRGNKTNGGYKIKQIK